MAQTIMNVVLQIFHIFTLFERSVIFRLDHNTHHCLCQHTGGDTSSLQGALFCSNTDRLTMDNIYGLGQVGTDIEDGVDRARLYVLK